MRLSAKRTQPLQPKMKIPPGPVPRESTTGSLLLPSAIFSFGDKCINDCGQYFFRRAAREKSKTLISSKHLSRQTAASPKTFKHKGQADFVGPTA